ncbi:hypothetical protein BHU72_07570 [Desulfuribacillus stibiiarsenatis]|uniref:Calcineurin-like phosphoesterase domain-containing protein n=2 Tax=Desulfuribacillus stibiiarsenatis TaxID=1390249 RepID=A0A1E5L423_9FIRM|nr:hypothetical protein BHU72_07570 [Desulfuribacillus stibiiarsenatis]
MFFVVVTIVLGFNLGWYLLSDWWLRKELHSYPKARRYSRIALVIWMFIVFVPIVSQLVGLGNPLEYGPWIWTSVLYLWMGAILFWMLGLAIIGIPTWGFLRYYDRKNRKQVTHSEQMQATEVLESTAQDNILSRRQVLKLGLVAAPPLLVGSTAIATVFAKDRLNVRYIDLPVRNLPHDLEGYTITHLSDTHVGIVTGRERIENIVNTANQLKSNMTVVTGDILDNNFEYMPDLVDTIGQLKADHGVHLCIGNHDKIHNANEWITTVRNAGMDLLLDESIVIDTGGTPIKLLGIDYSRQEADDYRNIRKADEHVNTPENGLKILLAHHPHAFDPASEADIPITLAGHTHGGQIAIRIGEEYELFNAGNYLFRYVDGIYRKEQGNSLYVHRGSGDWFPLRAGVPTEVVQIRLVREET